jgi:hypothetical protein
MESTLGVEPTDVSETRTLLQETTFFEERSEYPGMRETPSLAVKASHRLTWTRLNGSSLRPGQGGRCCAPRVCSRADRDPQVLRLAAATAPREGGFVTDPLPGGGRGPPGARFGG